MSENVYPEEVIKKVDKFLNNILEDPKLAEKAINKGLTNKLVDFWNNFGKKLPPHELKRYTRKLKKACKIKEGADELSKTELFKKCIADIKNIPKLNNKNVKKLW